MMGLMLRAAALCLVLAGSTQVADLASIDADGLSGDPERILKAIHAYPSLDSDSADVIWRLLRAYYNYYAEEDERDRSKQEWATDQGYTVAETARAKFSHKAEVVYYWATIGAAYAEVHRFKAIFLLGDLIKAFEEARRLDPALFHKERASNRLGLAETFAALKRYEDGWPHVEFIRSGNFWATSDHWKELFLRGIEEVAAEFPQNQK